MESTSKAVRMPIAIYNKVIPTAIFTVCYTSWTRLIVIISNINIPFPSCVPMPRLGAQVCALDCVSGLLLRSSEYALKRQKPVSRGCSFCATLIDQREVKRIKPREVCCLHPAFKYKRAINIAPHGHSAFHFTNP